MGHIKCEEVMSDVCHHCHMRFTRYIPLKQNKKSLPTQTTQAQHLTKKKKKNYAGWFQLKKKMLLLHRKKVQSASHVSFCHVSITKTAHKQRETQNHDTKNTQNTNTLLSGLLASRSY